MTERAVIVCPSSVREWAGRDKPPLPLPMISRALARIEEVISTLPPEDVVIVEEPLNTGFVTLPERVGRGNSVLLLGARAAYGLKTARTVLEEAGVEVTLDPVGALP